LATFAAQIDAEAATAATGQEGEGYYAIMYMYAEAEQSWLATTFDFVGWIPGLLDNGAPGICPSRVR
jgi:hypothetical protein